ncbi:MAG TPA: TfoX/Sxy family protein [Terriglobales bacterium]|nr:TfoX/Sxy family protein [Terriglobales bacterium]
MVTGLTFVGFRIVASSEYAEFLREQLASLGHITMRRMFGKTGIFCDGTMLGMVTENILYFRVDDENREAFEEARTWPPLSYAKAGRLIDLAFLACARPAVRPDEFINCTRLALAAAQRVAANRRL